MGRPSTLTDLATSSAIVSGTSYGPSNELLSMSGTITETRTYNSLLQLTQLVSSNTSGGSVNLTYTYSAAQNNGKITGMTDNISGEQVVYTYDSLNRLASATAGTTWGQSYGYDGFGNLTDQTVTAGSAPAYHVVYNAATNRQTTDCADTNGNLNSSAGGCGASSYNYDVANRIVSSATANQWQYSYAPHNRRVWRGVWTSGTLTTDEVTFWGADGAKLGTWALSTFSGQLIATATGSEYYFAGRLIRNSPGYVAADRLGSIGKYYPYGQEKPSTTQNGTEKFTGYLRDSETGNDYAINRYHSPGQGRFFTVDRSNKSINPNDPGSWNRYAYVIGDPVNNRDPNGLNMRNPDSGYCDPATQLCVCDPTENESINACGGDDGGGGCPEGVLGFLGSVAGTCAAPPPPPPPPPHTCKDNFTPIANSNGRTISVDQQFDFVAKNAVSAGFLSLDSGLQSPLILGWSAMESGFSTSSIAVSDNNYFSWAPHKASFSSYYESGHTALFSTADFFTYTYSDGTTKTGVSSISILNDQISQGAGIPTAFNKLAAAGYDPADAATYGRAVAADWLVTISIESCISEMSRNN